MLRQFIILCFSLLIASNAIASNNPNDYSDGEIIAFLIAFDKNAINSDSLIIQKSRNPSVRDFAIDMRKDSIKNLHDTLSLSRSIHIAPIRTRDINDEEVKGNNELVALHQLYGDELDMSYLRATIDDDKQSMAMIDFLLQKKDINPDLAQHLDATRNVIADHMLQTLDVRDDLASH